jgi:hypothetical protein
MEKVSSWDQIMGSLFKNEFWEGLLVNTYNNLTMQYVDPRGPCPTVNLSPI